MKKHPGGRPTDYKETHEKMAYRCCLLGATDEELAEIFGVAVATIYNWKLAHPKFLEATKKGKEDADRNVAESLYKRANGFTKKQVKIFQYQGQEVIIPYVEFYPPDVTAQIFWLKNRQPTKWRDKHDVEHDLSGSLMSAVASFLSGNRDGSRKED